MCAVQAVVGELRKYDKCIYCTVSCKVAPASLLNSGLCAQGRRQQQQQRGDMEYAEQHVRIYTRSLDFPVGKRKSFSTRMTRILRIFADFLIVGKRKSF